ncbi:MAG TPA: hypothetical protein VFV38_41270 [Ktedonobacteraceae bacterium]|nr:hypothetical protein [Ktedonobacteraceae bacterium]
MLTDTTIHPSSLLARLCRQEPLTTTTGRELLRQIPFLRWESSSGRKIPTTATLVAVDNGNDAFKGALLHAHDPYLCTRRIITAYAPAKQLGTGDGITTWQVNDSEPFWIGEDALQATKAESLPIGMTHDRLPDERYRRYLFASLVELLLEAGYEESPDGYDLYLSFGIPNEEVNRNGMNNAVRHALIPLFNTVYTIRRTDEQGQVTAWALRLVELNPYPQTFGSFVPWYYTVDGAPVETSIVKHLTLDIGGGQFHQCEVTIQHQPQGKPKLRMAASLIDDGTIALARVVRERIRVQHPGIRLSDVEAQQVLVSRHALIEGRRTSVEEIISEVIAARSQNLLTHLRHQLQDERSFLMFTGGGSILLAESLEALVRAKRRSESFLFVPKELAAVLNAMGGYILAQVTAQKLAERMPETFSRKKEP